MPFRVSTAAESEFEVPEETGMPGRQNSDETGRVRILIVEDDALFRDLLHVFLAGEATMEIVGVARDGETAVEMARELRPKVVIMDIELPGQLNGIDAGREIQLENPNTGILVLSAHKDRRYLHSVPLGQAPGWSYLLKQSVTDTGALVRAIEGSARGLVVLDPQVVAELRPREDSRLASLTPRQLEVLELMAQGYNNPAIAARLHLGDKSVQNYVNVIFQALQLSGEREIHARVRATLIYIAETRVR